MEIHSMKKWTVILIITLSVLGGCNTQTVKERKYRMAALKAAAWLKTVGVERPEGKIWAADPRDTTTIMTNLYSGSSGVVLFFLEAYRLTGKKTFLDEARSGADYLLTTLSHTMGPNESGLYTGLSGIGFVLAETFRITNESKYGKGVMQCLHLLRKSAEPTENGIRWSSVTDIISGSAGIGLFLLYVADKLDLPDALTLAERAGYELLARAITDRNGLKWAMDDSYPRLMPNFSHGTAGVAYFLMELHRVTDNPVFLDKALLGGRYLQSLATEDGMVFHHEPGGEDLFYLGWCHGPPGTTRLYYRLWRATGDPSWIEAIHRAAQTILHSGIPDTALPGFWNNVGQCCGSAGVADFFLSLYRLTNRLEYREFAYYLTDDLLARASDMETGLAWIQAEHRVRPDYLIAQTGYMQGAAGIGMWLLRISSNQREAKERIMLPDSPW